MHIYTAYLFQTHIITNLLPIQLYYSGIIPFVIPRKAGAAGFLWRAIKKYLSSFEEKEKHLHVKMASVYVNIWRLIKSTTRRNNLGVCIRGGIHLY